MGWISLTAARAARYSWLFLLATGLMAAGNQANAQVGTGDNLYQSISNGSLSLFVGSGKNVGGTFQVETSAGNTADPSAILLYGPVALTGNGIEAVGASPILVGTRLFVRVDGGKGGGGGYDYIFGRNASGAQSDGVWLRAPRIVGNHIEAAWQTLPIVVSGTTIDPRIEIDLKASLVHDQVRFEFDIKNNSPGTTHRVGLAFTEDIDTTFVTAGAPNFTLGGPLRLPNAPYLHRETILAGGQVPPFWDVFVLGNPASGSTVPRIRSIRGILAPLNSGQQEPTRPTRFAYGDLFKLNGFNPTPPAGVVGRDYNAIWNFVPDPNVQLEDKGASDAAVTCYWDEQAVAAGQTVSIVTYVGESSSDTDFTPPVSLSVSGPLALGLLTTKDANGVPTGCTVTPSTFTISAFVQNETDLSASGGITISPVTLFLDLPKGLILVPGETNPKTVLNVAPGSEGSASWQVMVDAAKPASGKLRYSVTASPNLGNGKSVQRTIEVPVPAVLNLPGTNTTQGLYKMVSFPFIFGNVPPSTIFHLNANQPSPDFDLVRWNPSAGIYEPVNTFVPGSAYWLRSRLTADKTLTIECEKYPPLANQVQPTSVPFPRDYPRGWNQIGSPNIFNVRFSEVTVFDPATGGLISTVDAADPLHRWIQPAVFYYDTTDINAQNWHYVLEDNFGFEMVPYQGYWLFVIKDKVQFLYPGVDTPGASVNRAALIGAGLGTRRSRASTSDWTLQLKAKGNISTDYTTTIGVNTKATEKLDYYKVSKPPTQENQLSLDIVHDEWATGSRYAKDIRSATGGAKTWQMVLNSTKPNEPVTFSWPDLATSVPRNYKVTLVDTDTNTRYDMRSTSSILLTTNANKTRKVQVIAESTRGNGPAVITGFDITQAGNRGAGAPSSVSINYTLSRDAETRIVIRTPGGRILRTLNGQPVTSSGATTGRAVFDLRDSEGRQIASGTYMAELMAHSTDGQVSRQVRPFLLTR